MHRSKIYEDSLNNVATLHDYQVQKSKFVNRLASTSGVIKNSQDKRKHVIDQMRRNLQH